MGNWWWSDLFPFYLQFQVLSPLYSIYSCYILFLFFPLFSRAPMGIGFMASSKRWASLIRPTSIPRQQQRHPSLLRGKEGEILHRDALKAYACSYRALQIIESSPANEEYMKINKDNAVHSAFHNLSRPVTTVENTSSYVASLKSSSHLQFSLLMENLGEMEGVLSGTDLARLERDILVHIERLGALKLFHACLSRTIMPPSTVDPKFLLTEHFKGKQKTNVVVRTRKKEERKLRRMRASSKGIHKVEESTVSPSTSIDAPTSFSNSRSRRSLIARNESQMSGGVKELVNLERIRMNLERETGHVPSYASWAEAAEIDQKTLQQRLQFGWYCRDKLIKSTHSLVVYLARNYRGMGIAFDDLLQAGNMGVLKGAERFDNTRGYRFSTYVQYWIRKSMLGLVARHSKGIYIPVSMENIIKRIRKARRALHNREGRFPPDDEMAELTGLSLAHVRLARKCSRIMGSLDQEMGDGWCTKYTEVTSDTSVKAPDEIITRQHMRKDTLKVLEALHPRERQVLELRLGIEDGRCKSLGEIGKLCGVTKEWIRKIEKAALVKLRREDVQRELKYYLNS